jgi:hypothetical protein
MKLVITKKEQLVGRMLGFSIIINGKPFGKLYNNSPLVIQEDWNDLEIEAKQLWIKTKLHIDNPKKNETIEVSYSLRDSYFLIFGFIMFLLLTLFMFYKSPIFVYISIIVSGLFTYQLVNRKSLVIRRVNN